jgi:hypothetical protein
VDLLEVILPKSYHETIGLLPWLVFTVVARVLLHTVHRFARMSNRRVTYDRTIVISALLSLPATFVGATVGGAEGAAFAAGLASLGAAGWLFFRSQTSSRPLPLDWPRITASIVLAIACAVGAQALGRLIPSVAPAFDAAAFVLYLVLVIVLGVVPRQHRRSLVWVRREVTRRSADSEIAARLDALTVEERDALRRGFAIQDSVKLGLGRAREFGLLDDEERTRAELEALEVLRDCTRTRRKGEPAEAMLAHFLFGRMSPLERHHAVNRLYGERVDPDEVATLLRWREDAYRAVRA